MFRIKLKCEIGTQKKKCQLNNINDHLQRKERGRTQETFFKHVTGRAWRRQSFVKE